MKSQARGKSTSNVEIQDVRKNGIWLYCSGKEYFLSYDDYPWFLNATISQIYNVELKRGYHLRWPDLDVELELESLDQPGKFPLSYKN